MTVTAESGVVPGQPTLAVTGARAEIRLNRPAQHNRLENGDIVLLRRYFAQLGEAGEVRVLVLTGSGRTFCSGYDLGALGRGEADRPAGASFEALTDELEHLRIPTICALNGPVYGGGTDLAQLPHHLLHRGDQLVAGGCRLRRRAAPFGNQRPRLATSRHWRRLPPAERRSGRDRAPAVEGPHRGQHGQGAPSREPRSGGCHRALGGRRRSAGQP